MQPRPPVALNDPAPRNERSPIASGEPRLRVRQGHSFSGDADEAVGELAAQIDQPDIRSSLVFFSDDYDPLKLGQALQDRLKGTVIGCTSAGQIAGSGFQRGGISGASLAGNELFATPFLIHPLSTAAKQIERIAGDIQKQLAQSGLPAFGFLLVDGLSMKEELLISTLYMALGDIPIIGGSAGDSLKFKQTFVYHQGRLLQDAAVLTLFTTSLPFHIFKHQHFLPTSTRLVVTAADPGKRLVIEINGEPAARAYAQLIGVTPDRLDSVTISRHPLMLRIGNDYYVRSVAGVEPDGSLRFFCAIDAGLVLTIGQGDSAVEMLDRELRQVREYMGDPAVIIGCDCILRRLEMEEQGVDHQIGQLLAANKVVGFSTYGEQCNSVHVNQTFMGVAIAG